MIKAENTSIILLTYKGKILLMLFESNPNILENAQMLRKSAWKFIGALKAGHESFQDAILKRVKGLTGLKLDGVELLSTIVIGHDKKYLYHARLTDEDVNNMERTHGLLLQFFSFKELDLLTLSESTQLFVSKHRDYIQNIHFQTEAILA